MASCALWTPGRVGARGVKVAHWADLGLLLQDTNTTNQLYAIDMLDHMSLAGRSDDRWRRTDDFKRYAVFDGAVASNLQTRTKRLPVGDQLF